MIDRTRNERGARFWRGEVSNGNAGTANDMRLAATNSAGRALSVRVSFVVGKSARSRKKAQEAINNSLECRSVVPNVNNQFWNPIALNEWLNYDRKIVIDRFSPFFAVGKSYDVIPIQWAAV